MGASWVFVAGSTTTHLRIAVPSSQRRFDTCHLFLEVLRAVLPTINRKREMINSGRHATFSVLFIRFIGTKLWIAVISMMLKVWGWEVSMVTDGKQGNRTVKMVRFKAQKPWDHYSTLLSDLQRVFEACRHEPPESAILSGPLPVERRSSLLPFSQEPAGNGSSFYDYTQYYSFGLHVSGETGVEINHLASVDSVTHKWGSKEHVVWGDNHFQLKIWNLKYCCLFLLLVAWLLKPCDLGSKSAARSWADDEKLIPETSPKVTRTRLFITFYYEALELFKW